MMNRIWIAGTRGQRLWVISVSFADGPGYKAKKISYSPNEKKAASFSRIAAEALTRQLCMRYKVVTHVRGEEEAVIAPTVEQVQARRRVNAELAEFNRELLQIVRRTISR